MKLYITPLSPYARVTQIAAAEKGLLDRIDVIVAETRKPASPYYAINPSGRVPYLVTSDGLELEDSQLIARYFDHLAGPPTLTPDGWAYGRLEMYARSMVDGLSVWVRELRRPESERSFGIIAHEAARAGRLADFWDREVTSPLMTGPANLAQLYLYAALDLASYGRLANLEQARPALAGWTTRMRGHPAIKAAALPER